MHTRGDKMKLKRLFVLVIRIVIIILLIAFLRVTLLPNLSETAWSVILSLAVTVGVLYYALRRPR
jgi:hypothetical protein